MHFIEWCASLMPWARKQGEDRDAPRLDVATEVTLTCAGYKLAGCHARNISHRGVYLETYTESLPAPGTWVSLNFHIWTGQVHITRQVDAEVVRLEGRCVALAFDEKDLAYAAVVDDVVYYLEAERRSAPRGLLKDTQDDIAA